MANNDPAAVPELQGKAKSRKHRARPIIAGTQAPALKVYHARPHSTNDCAHTTLGLDTDLAQDNLENDLPLADLQD